MLKITSTNAACYITVVTGYEARVESKENYDGSYTQNYFVFDANPEVVAAFTEYREATREQREQLIDVIKFIRQFTKYKSMSRKYTASLRK